MWEMVSLRIKETYFRIDYMGVKNILAVMWTE
jgi:hypothetical protein